jgi:hypothetical protein
VVQIKVQEHFPLQAHEEPLQLKAHKQARQILHQVEVVAMDALAHQTPVQIETAALEQLDMSISTEI